METAKVRPQLFQRFCPHEHRLRGQSIPPRGTSLIP